MVDKNGNPVKVPTSMTYGESAEKGWTYGHKMTADEARRGATTKASIEMVQDLGTLTQEGGAADLSGMYGFMEQFRAGSDIPNIVANKFLDMVGIESTDANIKALALTTSLSNQVLASFRGSQVGPAEQKLFQKQLPIPGQPRAVFKANRLLTEKNLKIIDDFTKLVRGGGGIATPQPIPATLADIADELLPPDDGYTIGQVEDGYEYIGGDSTSDSAWREM